MRKPLERHIEGSVVHYAKVKGVESVKLNGIGKRSLPDRMFLGPRGTILFIEFKRAGEEPTELQRWCHNRWRDLGHVVHVVDNVREGRELIDSMLHRRMDLMYPLEDR